MTFAPTASHPPRRLRYAMVGGGRDAFIGAVHRKAAALDGQIELVAGALSSSPNKARASGRDLFLADGRNHGSWQELLADELRRSPEERIDFVSIVTPNHLHYPVAKAFVDAGFHVVCDKPLVHTSTQALDLQDAVQRQGQVFAVSYNYTGYPMVRQMRHMVQSGAIGTIRKVVVEYQQGWLATAAESSGSKQAAWRVDPVLGGIAGAMGDIGSHAENLLTTVTGLTIESLCADLSAMGAGRTLDDDGSMLLRLQGGARGVLMASQICVGSHNDLRLRVHGTEGSLSWAQEAPNHLSHSAQGAPASVLTTASHGLCDAALKAARLPAGHPEGFIEAFANIYLGVAADIRARLQGLTATPAGADYPRIDAGVRGVHFIEKVVESAASSQKWTRLTGSAGT